MIDNIIEYHISLIRIM